MTNEYEKKEFFDQYAQMPRSKGGLPAAGEWHQLRPLFPPLEGKSVLDLGCGYGWHCKFAEEQGGARILGIDLSGRMIAEAKRRNSGAKITYRVCGIEEYEYPEGIFLFNIEHPVFTAGQGQDWIYEKNGRPQYWPVDDYFMPGERRTNFLGCDVIKQHHTLTQIMMGLINSGFGLEAVEEAKPPEEMMDIPGMRDELRRPMMLLVKARVRQKEVFEDFLRW